MTQPVMLAVDRKWLLGLGLLVLAIGGAAGWLLHAGQGPVGEDRAAVEKVVREYILAHPEILPEAMRNLQQKQNAQQLSGIRSEVERAFPGAVLGNPKGSVTLVEFTDFACTYCRQAVADVEALVAAHPDLKVVVRELPILSPQSADAARMALAAAEQGKYRAFHHAMFAAGRPSPETIDAAARAAGLDMARAKSVAASAAVANEINRNLELAQTLEFNGTPSWVAGDDVFSGAVGIERLTEAVASARKKAG